MRIKLTVLGVLLLTICISTSAVLAQPAGWSELFELNVKDTSGITSTDLQIAVFLNTAMPISLGLMQPNGADLRFGLAPDGAGGQLNYWIESGINSSNTKVWVQIPSIVADTTTPFYAFWGNPAANSVSAITATFEGPFSGNQQLTGGAVGGSVGDHQRGFHFTTSRDLLIVAMGKYEPNGTTRTLTLFRFENEEILAQGPVSGPADTYSYNNLPAPLWVLKNPDWDPLIDPDPTYGYVALLFGSSTDQYYNDQGLPVPVGPYLSYVKTRFCNACAETTFPTSTVIGHFGYPDIQYFARAAAPDPEPSVGLGLFSDDFE